LLFLTVCLLLALIYTFFRLLFFKLITKIQNDAQPTAVADR
jgi:hypothetical protein